MLAFTGMASAAVTNTSNVPNKVIFGYLPAGQQITKTELTAKLDKLNILVYGFLQTQSNIVKPNIGSLDNHQDEVAAFAKLNNTQKNLKKIFAVGGAGHDNTFLSIFYDTTGKAITNFTDSAKTIIDKYNLDGISLNYAPSTHDFTAAEAAKYATLIQALRAKLGPDKIITVTISVDPLWINTITPDGWNIIQHNVNYIILKSYDFHGAFDYPSQTGFLTSLYTDPNSTYGNNELSIETARYILTDKNHLNIPSEKIIIGVPAFGRAVQDVADVDNGLYQLFDATIPKGNLDQANACTGAFSYHYIVKNMLGKGFHEHEYRSGNTISAVWAYAPNTWKAPKVAKTLKSTTLNNIFISYANVNLVKAEAQYVNTNDLGGMVLWPITGDTPVSSSTSLLSAMYNSLN